MRLARARISLVARAACVAGLLVLLALLARRIEWSEVRAALAGADLRLVAAAAALNFLNLAFKAARWQALLRPVRDVALTRLFNYLIVSYAASALLPARAGEGLRLVFLRARHGVAVADALGVIVVEKLFELFGLLCVVLPLPLLATLPTWASTGILALGAGAVAVVAAALLLSRRLEGGADGGWRRLARSVTFLRDTRRSLIALAWSVGAYLIDACEIALVLLALGIDLHWATPPLVLLGGNLAIAIPLTPGQLGALEAGVVAALAIVHVPIAQALAFALVYHLMQLLPIVAFGVSGLRFVARGGALARETVA